MVAVKSELHTAPKLVASMPFSFSDKVLRVLSINKEEDFFRISIFKRALRLYFM